VFLNVGHSSRNDSSRTESNGLNNYDDNDPEGGDDDEDNINDNNDDDDEIRNYNNFLNSDFLQF
jgi:hypothetical protein